MPNKTIYVPDEDLPLLQRAQAIAGGSLSAAIVAALKRYVEIEDGRQEGFDEIVVKVGPGSGRKLRFSGVLLGEWGRVVGGKVEIFRVYRSRTGKFAVHTERSADATSSATLRDWRTWFGDQTWGVAAGDASLRIAENLEELKELVPTELYDMVAAAAEFPAVEDLDI